jgi:hypothetical protein
MTNPSHEGGCLCGAIRYRADADSVARTHCHCRSCRLAAGAPSLAWAVFPSAAFRFTRGEPTRYASSPGVTRTFCGRCGSTLTWQDDGEARTIDIASATLDDADAFAPTREIWVADKLAWQPLDPTLPHYPGSSRDTRAVYEPPQQKP